MSAKLTKGLIEVYTGDGKGKTTAALGLALRAAGAGMRVYIHQFIKNACYGEISALKSIKNIVVEQSGRGCFIRGKPRPVDIARARGGLKTVARRMASGRFSVVILDEINVSLAFGLIDADELLRLVKSKPKNIELVLTGRSCPKTILKHADLITEMKNIRHPYDRGTAARRGIEF